MNDLRYPVGKFTPLVTYTAELRRQFLAQIAACPTEIRRAVAGLSAAQLAALHERWGRFLGSLPPDSFERSFLHPDIPGPVTLDKSVAMYAWHGRHHVAHVDALRRSNSW